MSSTANMFLDWSQLPEELLHLISKNLEDDYCFDVVHARSVCRSWRSAFTFPPSLLRPSYSLPSFPSKGNILEKVPLFLFRIRAHDADAAEYLLGGISRDGSNDHKKLLLPSPLQCSVKVKIPGCDHPILMNMLDCQIIPLGHQYKMIGRETDYVAFISLNKEGGGGFTVLHSFFNNFSVLKSVEMRWKHLENIPNGRCTNIVTFRGRFYATFTSKKVVAIDPYSLEVTLLLLPSPQRVFNYLIPCGDDELFLVETFISALGLVDISFRHFTCKVSKLDEKAGTWVEVKDLGDRVLFIRGRLGNVSCSGKEFPHGCGLNGNSILFTNQPGNVTFGFKYENELNCWRYLRKKRVVILNKSLPVMTIRVES